MTLRDQILSGIKDAMRARDQVRLDSLRFVWSRAKELEIDKKGVLSDEEIQTLVSKEVKARREAIEQFRAAGRGDLVTQEEGKLAVLMELLPQQMSEGEIIREIDAILSLGLTDYGTVMAKAMAYFKGKADGSIVARIVKQKLS